MVAQGWPKLGDLRTLCTLVEKEDRDAFIHKVKNLHLIAYGNKYSSQASRIMWDLLSLRSGDLVVGIEGVAVKGICQLEQNGMGKLPASLYGRIRICADCRLSGPVG